MTEAQQIAIEDAIARVDGGAWLLDVREQNEWDAGHAPQAHLIPMGQVMERLDEIPIDEEIVVVCHSGYRSWQVTKALVNGGYDAVNASGGMEAWQSAGGVVTTDGSGSTEA
jgi:rhodanese-related sulfurtransferase